MDQGEPVLAQEERLDLWINSVCDAADKHLRTTTCSWTQTSGWSLEVSGFYQHPSGVTSRVQVPAACRRLGHGPRVRGQTEGQMSSHRGSYGDKPFPPFSNYPAFSCAHYTQAWRDIWKQLKGPVERTLCCYYYCLCWEPINTLVRLASPAASNWQKLKETLFGF